QGDLLPGGLAAPVPSAGPCGAGGDLREVDGAIRPTSRATRRGSAVPGPGGGSSTGPLRGRRGAGVGGLLVLPRGVITGRCRPCGCRGRVGDGDTVGDHPVHLI